MGGAIHPLSQYAFMAWCPVKAQGLLKTFIISAYAAPCEALLHAYFKHTVAGVKYKI
jgi:hypothetical protein